MSSKFVSGGSLENPTERDDEWLKAEKELEDKRRVKAEQEKQQQSGKTLYETLQENKAKKQDAFEEANKLKNQFRALDEDEEEFLDSINQAERAKEAAIRKETASGLEAFRKQQEAAERAALTAPVPEQKSEGTEAWAVKNRKRKKGAELVKGVKLRKTSSSLGRKGEEPEQQPKSDVSTEGQLASKVTATKPEERPVVQTSAVPLASKLKETAPTNALGLGGYSSDED